LSTLTCTAPYSCIAYTLTTFVRIFVGHVAAVVVAVAEVVLVDAASRIRTLAVSGAALAADCAQKNDTASNNTLYRGRYLDIHQL